MNICPPSESKGCFCFGIKQTYWRWGIVEVFVQFSRMEVRDELVQLPWNTVWTQRKNKQLGLMKKHT